MEEIKTQAMINEVLNNPAATCLVITDDRDIRNRIKEEFQIADGNCPQISFGPELGMDDRGGTDVKAPMFTRPTTMRRALLEFCILAMTEHRTYTKGSTVCFLVEWLHAKYGGNDGRQPKFIGRYREPNSPTMNFKTEISGFLKECMPLLKVPHENPIEPLAMQILMNLRPDQLDDLYDVIVEALGNTRNWQMPAARLAGDHILKIESMKVNRNLYQSSGRFAIRWLRALIMYRLQIHLEKKDTELMIGMLEDEPTCTVWMYYNYHDDKSSYNYGSSSSSNEPPRKMHRVL